MKIMRQLGPLTKQYAGLPYWGGHSSNHIFDYTNHECGDGVEGISYTKEIDSIDVDTSSCDYVPQVIYRYVDGRLVSIEAYVPA